MELNFEEKWRMLYYNFIVHLAAAYECLGERNAIKLMKRVGQLWIPSYEDPEYARYRHDPVGYAAFFTKLYRVLGCAAQNEKNSVVIAKCGFTDMIHFLELNVPKDIFCKNFCGNHSATFQAIGMGFDSRLVKTPKHCKLIFA